MSKPVTIMAARGQARLCVDDDRAGLSAVHAPQLWKQRAMLLASFLTLLDLPRDQAVTRRGRLITVHGVPALGGILSDRARQLAAELLRAADEADES